MQDKLENIVQSAKESLKHVEDEKGLQELKVTFLGKKGKLTEILRGMGNVPAERGARQWESS